MSLNSESDSFNSYKESINPSSLDVNKYRLKTFFFKENAIKIVMHNQLGETLLVAICNFFLLKSFFVIPFDLIEVNLEYLFDLLTFVIETKSADGYISVDLDTLQLTLAEIFPKLRESSAIDFYFSDIDQFKKCPVIDFINSIKISFFHTCVVDCKEEDSYLVDLSYFDLEKKLLNQKYFGDVEETSFLEDFLSKNSATTELGLKRLISKMDDDDFALFFSFNEYRTIYKVLNNNIILFEFYNFMFF